MCVKLFPSLSPHPPGQLDIVLEENLQLRKAASHSQSHSPSSLPTTPTPPPLSLTPSPSSPTPTKQEPAHASPPSEDSPVTEVSKVESSVWWRCEGVRV